MLKRNQLRHPERGPDPTRKSPGSESPTDRLRQQSCQGAGASVETQAVQGALGAPFDIEHAVAHVCTPLQKGAALATHRWRMVAEHDWEATLFRGPNQAKRHASRKCVKVDQIGLG